MVLLLWIIQIHEFLIIIRHVQHIIAIVVMLLLFLSNNVAIILLIKLVGISLWRPVAIIQTLAMRQLKEFKCLPVLLSYVVSLCEAI